MKSELIAIYEAQRQVAANHENAWRDPWAPAETIRLHDEAAKRQVEWCDKVLEWLRRQSE